MLFSIPIQMPIRHTNRCSRRPGSVSARSHTAAKNRPPLPPVSSQHTYNPLLQKTTQTTKRSRLFASVQTGGGELSVQEGPQEHDAQEMENEEEAVEEEKLTSVTFSITRDTEFGQHLSILGSHPVLGEWSVADSVPMDWVKDNRWEVTIQLPQFELVEYKYIVRCGWNHDGPAIWQGGPNCMMATNQSTALSVSDSWVFSDWPETHPVITATSAAVAIYAQEHPKPRYSPPKDQAYIPAWAKEAVFYQIFPLGFVGAPSVNPGEGEEVTPRLNLVIDRLDFLQDLGVTAVYFSPLFESDTHGYDTADYFQVDRRLGDVTLMKTVVEECHARGMKVVLDGVFNHTGQRHFAFQDLMRKGPVSSPYSNWYLLGARQDDYEGWCALSTMDEGDEGDFGFSYDCWEGHDMLPRLNISEPAVREHIFKVAEFWLTEVNVDGWRLDVAHEISPEFWKEFRQVCDKVKPECLLVGEMIHGNYKNWVGSDRLHSGTNYQLSTAIWNSLNEHNYDELVTALLREHKLYSGLSLLNFLGNHDVTRIASALNVREHYTLATATLMLLPGIPCLYYGDELGMEGRPGEGDDPLCGGDDAMRRPMPSAVPDASWPEVGEARLAVTKQLVQIKRDNPAFIFGTMSMDRCRMTPTTFLFVREAPEQIAVVLLNSANEEAHPWPEMDVPESIAPEGATFTDIFDPERREFVVTDGKLYIGPCFPNSVRILTYDIPEKNLEPEPVSAESDSLVAECIPSTTDAPAAKPQTRKRLAPSSLLKKPSGTAPFNGSRPAL